MHSRQINLEGSHREIGQQIGKLYKQWGKKEVYIPPFCDTYYSQQLELYEKYFPEYIQLLDGIAEGFGIESTLVRKSYLTGFLAVAHEPHKCSTFAVKSNQGVLVGRNYDWLESSELHSKLFKFNFTDEATHSFVGISDMGTWQPNVKVGTESFIVALDEVWNASGLYIALNGAPGHKKGSGISAPHVIQLIAEKCSTTEEAIVLLRELPIPESKIFTLADRSGQFAVVEKSLELGTRVIQSNDSVVVTNHFNHPDLQPMNIEIFKDVPFHSTFGRHAYLTLTLAKYGKELDLDKVQSLMGKAPTLQNWRGKQNGDVLTIWITALNLANMQYQVRFAPLQGHNELYL